MKKIKISAEFEREIKAALDIDLIDEMRSALKKIRQELDDAGIPKKIPGISYSKIIECLKVGLGARLAYPSKPHISWIIKQVNQVKELGLNESELVQLGHAASKTYNYGRPVELDFVLRSAVRLLHSSGDGEVSGNKQKVFTGREGDGDD